MLAAEYDIETNAHSPLVLDIAWLGENDEPKPLWGYTGILTVSRGTAELVRIEDPSLILINVPESHIKINIPWQDLELALGTYTYSLFVADLQRSSSKLLTGKLRVK